MKAKAMAVHPAVQKNPGLVSWPSAAAHLELYRPALEEGLGKLVLFVLPQAITFASSDVRKVADYAAAQASAGANVYLHIHLHDLPEGELAKRGSLSTVRAAIAVLGDIDCAGPGRRKPAHTLCGSLNDAVYITEQFIETYKPLRPSLVIRSGYGIYPALLFREPLVINTEADRQHLESLSRRFHAALHAIASKPGWTGAVDFCDAAKVLRLPGTINWKDPQHPKPVSLWWETPARFDPSDLEEILPAPRGEITVPGAELVQAAPLEVEDVVANEQVDIPPLFLSALRETHPNFGATWDNQRADLEDQSCSGYDMALAGIAVTCGLTNQQIADLITLHRREFPREKKHRRGTELARYIARTIAKARTGKQSSAQAQQEWLEVEGQISSGDFNEAVIKDGDNVPAESQGIAKTEEPPIAVLVPGGVSINAGAPRDALVFDPAASPPFEKFDSLRAVDRKFSAAWDHFRRDLQDQNQAAYDETLARAAAAKGWTDQELVDLVIANRRRFGAELNVGGDYFRKMIAQAREAAEPTLLDEKLVQLTEPNTKTQQMPPAGANDPVKAENNSDVAEPGGANSHAGGPADPKKRALLDVLSARFKVPLKRIVRYMGEPTLYRLETHIGDVQLGGVAGLINQSKLRIAIADATGRYLPQFDPETWPSVAQALLDACESVDRGQDATLRGTLGEWLRGYLAEKSIHKTLAEADEGREPFRDGDTIVIFASDFKRWLQIRQNERVAQGRLTADLRAFGAEPGVFKAVINNRSTTRSAWRLPAGPWIPVAA